MLNWFTTPEPTEEEDLASMILEGILDDAPPVESMDASQLDALMDLADLIGLDLEGPTP
jgi:hypothetical protein